MKAIITTAMQVHNAQKFFNQFKAVTAIYWLVMGCFKWSTHVNATLNN
jgi:hypothetical protein